MLKIVVNGVKSYEIRQKNSNSLLCYQYCKGYVNDIVIRKNKCSITINEKRYGIEHREKVNRFDIKIIAIKEFGYKQTIEI